MTKALRPLAIALQFLTRLPITLRVAPNDAEIGRSLLCYPLVGLLIGALLAALGALLHGHLAPLPAAALLLAVWVGASGGLHLDGLADSADGWAGARGDAARALAIMKEPTCGPLGVVALVIVLLVKFAALSVIVATDSPWPFVVAPLLGRALLLPLFLTTDYVRPGGLGATMHEHLPRLAAWLLFAAIAALLTASGMTVLGPTVAALIAFMALRRTMLRTIGGMTGDTAGALVEVVEATTLLCCAALV